MPYYWVQRDMYCPGFLITLRGSHLGSALAFEVRYLQLFRGFVPMLSYSKIHDHLNGGDVMDKAPARGGGSLGRVRRVCRFIYIALKVLFAVFCVAWIVSLGTILYSLVNPSAFAEIENADLPSLILCILYGAIAAAMFVVFIRMFAGVAKSESPFTLIQVKRLRIISMLLVFYAIVDACVAISTPFLQLCQMGSNQMGSGYASTTEWVVFPINFSAFIAAVVVFAFSFVFKYGVLLQKRSDETL